MQYTIFTLLATAASLASAQSVPVGANCDPNGTPCAMGANCYAVNSMLQPVCGNFQATCKSDSQCAFNTCNNGFCNGFLASSSAASATPTVTSSSAVHPSSTAAAAGTLPLGAKCDGTAAQSQCANGANCYAVNSMLQPVCGNFQASCKSDSQCAFNTCNNGLCNGFLASSSASNGTVVAKPSSASGSAYKTATRSATATGNVTASRTGGVAEFTGAAAVATMVPEVMAIVLGVAAWAL
ncbi:hypothetical protein N0V86_009510 [Didymella sp. IMI 355093]|nr:hypothetical protein N0V86_009510 [Didymella sp. IMI 355093]